MKFARHVIFADFALISVFNWVPKLRQWLVLVLALLRFKIGCVVQLGSNWCRFGFTTFNWKLLLKKLRNKVARTVSVTNTTCREMLLLLFVDLLSPLRARGSTLLYSSRTANLLVLRYPQCSNSFLNLLMPFGTFFYIFFLFTLASTGISKPPGKRGVRPRHWKRV